MSKLNTKITLKRPTKKEIQSVLEVGVQLQTKVEEITQIIKRDLHHQDEIGRLVLIYNLCTPQ